MSVIAWLDTSTEEERRMRELVKMLSDSDTLDDLGIGQIRDAFGDLLFPGISTVQTRARYLLFVPWTYRRAARRHSGAELASRAANEERQLVNVLSSEGATDGLIGRRAGVRVKVLPSSIYWTGLKTYDILRADVRPSGLQQTRRFRPHEDGPDEAGSSDWSSSLPPAPDGYPKTVPGGFDLTATEAAWLREQMATAKPHPQFEHSLLSHLLRRSDAPDGAWSAPWDVDDLASAPAALPDLVHHAEMFSLVIQGARLLYNLLLAERYEKLGLTSLDAPADYYRELLDEWAARCESRRDDVTVWQLSDLWPLVTMKAPRISPATTQFVESWVNAVQSQDCHTLATDPALRRLVSDREFQNKRAQSRLRNDKLLATWQGASGTTPLVYRWFQARRIVTDIFEGLGRADS
ncbi:DUF6361 family protein [Prescottella equi]|nr:DUF6361 family protein [Prescottella equi]MBM4481685.1 hypothetical protein [Prescottella equi]MBM4481698.1 hypothetical protein [Prescottella equi]MBM4581477.1 hypothetical protein [Prescottella equi]MBM4718447.1 hypothetical protein [Prescottella equi]MBP0078761.1 hypothetical protein [Prescottella equi]